MQRCNLPPPRAVSATATGGKGCRLGGGEGATEPFDFILDTNRLFREMTVRPSVERGWRGALLAERRRGRSRGGGRSGGGVGEGNNAYGGGGGVACCGKGGGRREGYLEAPKYPLALASH